MRGLPAVKRDRRVLVDQTTLDDAGVFALGRGEALVQTVDFFTPIVDDPYDYGRIAAANALSDVYAMGGTPLTALALLCVPDGTAPGVLRDILRGGQDAMKEAGCSIVGGHSVRDPELKFGYASPASRSGVGCSPTPARVRATGWSSPSRSAPAS